MDDNLKAVSLGGNIDAFYSLVSECPNVLEEVDEKAFVDSPMHIAAAMGHTSFALEMMRLKPSFAKKINPQGFTPMHLALQNGHTQLVFRLLDVDRDLVRVQGKEGLTPLHYVAKQGNLQLLDAFISACPASLEDVTIRNQTALHVVLESDMLESFDVLLKACGRLSHALVKRLLNWKDEDGNTPLHIATIRIQRTVVKSLLACGVDVNPINMAGMTALDISKQQNGVGDCEIRDLLGRANALEAASLPRVNCLMYYLRRDEKLKDAAEAGDTSTLYSLIQEDPCILERFDDIPYADTPLHIAARLGHFSFAMEIMRWKPSFAKKPNQEGLCPIHVATINGHIHTLKQLLSFDTGLVRLQGREGKTSLHCAAEKGDILLLDTLLSNCPLSIEDVTDRNDTALHIALKYSRFGAFYFLLRILRTALYEGSTERETRVLNSQDEKGNTVLHIAVQMNQPQVVKQLMDSTIVNVNVKNSKGLTAWDVSRECQVQENKEIRDMLNKAGASHGSSVRGVATAADNWISKISRTERVVTSMIRYKRDMSMGLRNLILAVSVLIATITYQTAVEPPTKRDDDKNISCILTGPTNSSSANSTITCSMHDSRSSSNPLIGELSATIILFWTSNIIAVLSSLVTIFFLLPSKNIRLLYVPLYFFVYCYMVTTAISSDSWLWCVIAGALFFILYTMLFYVDEVSKRVKQKENSVLATARE